MLKQCFEVVRSAFTGLTGLYVNTLTLCKTGLLAFPEMTISGPCRG